MLTNHYKRLFKIKYNFASLRLAIILIYISVISHDVKIKCTIKIRYLQDVYTPTFIMVLINQIITEGNHFDSVPIKHRNNRPHFTTSSACMFITFYC